MPLSTYDDYAPYIERMVEKGERNLITAYPIVQYSNLDTYYLVIQDEEGKQMTITEEFQIDIAFSVDGFDFFS